MGSLSPGRFVTPPRDRIASVMDTESLRDSCVALIGCGASADLARNLARCGVGRFTLVDPDAVAWENVARQGYGPRDVGEAKVTALGKGLRAIDPAVLVRRLAADFTAMTDEAIGRQLGDADLLLLATDNHDAQAMGNRIALRHGKPALWIGLYGGAGAGEIVWWKPGLPCYRCLCANRYRAQAARRSDPLSDGADIFSVGLLDSIAGMIAIGLLTEGSDDRYGRLIGQLGDRNFIQIQIQPDYRMNGRELFREQLQVPEGNDRFFSWHSIARRDPERGIPPCPDCLEFGNVNRPRCGPNPEDRS